MFERFTKDARTAVVHAQEEARELMCSSIGPEHVALGVLSAGGPAVQALRAAGADPAALSGRLRQVATGSGLDKEALAALGIDLEEVSRSADTLFGAGALERAGRRRQRRRTGHIPFTGEAKKALELSLREALRTKDKAITDRHVLLGVLRAGGPASDALRADVGEDHVRGALEAEPGAA
ncbi:Clp protease N-terminal domain-containing protein [Georgenia deserti]|uniref:Clp protease N-terminal domain-containing protein n=1 Tax=Georgenia deserti TaxID=2093781 RepID=A0ABW4KZ09_9MICO